MKRALVISMLLGAMVFAAPTSESVRGGSTFFVGRTGTVWVYAADKGKARVVIDRVENWASHFHYEWGKQSASGSWRIKDGAWMEKLPGRTEEIVLPAQVAVGARWTGLSSIERGGSSAVKFEVISLDATVELPSGETQNNCVAVLETGTDGDKPVTHFYAPNVGMVAVQGGDGWLLRMLEVRVPRPGGGGD